MKFLFDLGGVFFDWDPNYYFINVFSDPKERKYFLENVCNDAWNIQQDAGRSVEEAEIELISKFPKYERQIKMFYANHRDMIKGTFSQSIKITESQFNLWLRILKNTPNSILWLLESNKECMNNLKAYAKNKDIESSRICFAKKTKIEDHINRHQIIDLYLDTFPYNSHTSASDAIWAHCPVLTKSGNTFSSRVAGSILSEVGCSELIVDSDEAYINEAIKYASDKESLKLIKEKIIKGKAKSNLFRPKVFTRNLEEIYSRVLPGST